MHDTIVIGVGTAGMVLVARPSEACLSPTERAVASDEAMDAWLLAHVTAQHHSASICKIGLASDSMSEEVRARSSQ